MSKQIQTVSDFLELSFIERADYLGALLDRLAKMSPVNFETANPSVDWIGLDATFRSEIQQGLERLQQGFTGVEVDEDYERTNFLTSAPKIGGTPQERAERCKRLADKAVHYLSIAYIGYEEAPTANHRKENSNEAYDVPITDLVLEDAAYLDEFDLEYTAGHQGKFEILARLLENSINALIAPSATDPMALTLGGVRTSPRILNRP